MQYKSSLEALSFTQFASFWVYTCIYSSYMTKAYFKYGKPLYSCLVAVMQLTTTNKYKAIRPLYGQKVYNVCTRHSLILHSAHQVYLGDSPSPMEATPNTYNILIFKTQIDKVCHVWYAFNLRQILHMHNEYIIEMCVLRQFKYVYFFYYVFINKV